MDYIIIPLVLFLGVRLKNNFSALEYRDYKLLNKLYVYHILMSVVFYVYLKANGGDAYLYWVTVKEYSFDLIINDGFFNLSPTKAMFFINYIPSVLLDLSFFSGCILYGVVGYSGFLFLVLTLKKKFPEFRYLNKLYLLNISVFPAILFLPNLHFWSSGIGKDTLSFSIICYFFYAVLNIRNHIFGLFISMLVLYLIRPHILLFLMAVLGMSFLMKSRLLLIQKVFLTIIGLILFFPLLNKVLEFVHIDNLSFESFNKFSERKSIALGRSSSGIDLSSLPYPLQVFTFLYRPLFFDAGNVLGLLSSLENVVYVIFSFSFVRSNPIKVLINSSFLILFSFLFWLSGALAFAPSMSNLGIIIRERNMFLPAFIIFIVASLISKNKKKSYKVR